MFSQIQVATVLPVLQKHHWLLVTLLFCNAVALETLPIFLDRIVPSHLAIFISVIAVLFVGEVIPQAICIGPQQLAIAESLCPFVMCLMWVTSPISWPIAKLLDCILGEHKLTRFNNSQLKAIVDMHRLQSLDKDQGHYEVNEFGPEPDRVGLNQLQARVIRGALTSKVATAKDALKPSASVYSLTCDTLVDQDKLKEIRNMGFSRIPLFLNDEGKKRNVVVGVLLTKSLVGLEAPRADADSDDEKK